MGVSTIIVPVSPGAVGVSVIVVETLPVHPVVIVVQGPGVTVDPSTVSVLK